MDDSNHKDSLLDVRIEQFRQRFSDLARPHRRDPALIEQRRKQVWEMSLEGITYSTMASILKVTRQTISSDLDYIKKSEAEKITGIRNSPKLAEADIAITARKLETIAEACMQEYLAATTAQDKHRFLDAAHKTIVSRNRVLVETGMLPKAGIEIKSTVEHVNSFEDKYGKDSKFKIMDDAATRRRVLAVAEAAIKLGLKAEFDKPIDVEGRVVENLPAVVEQPKSSN
jgi:hypothetical protein